MRKKDEEKVRLAVRSGVVGEWPLACFRLCALVSLSASLWNYTGTLLLQNGPQKQTRAAFRALNDVADVPGPYAQHLGCGTRPRYAVTEASNGLELLERLCDAQ